MASKKTISPATDYLSLGEAADILRLSMSKIMKLIGGTAPEVPSAKIGTRRIIRRVDLDAFVAKKMNSAEGAAETKGDA